MKLLEQFRQWLMTEQTTQIEEPPLGEAEDPFDQPVVLEISDVIDLHSIPPKQIKSVVEEYLAEARGRGFQFVRIIHGKGIGVQREVVRTILERTPFVLGYHDAPPGAGGLGATIAELKRPDAPQLE